MMLEITTCRKFLIIYSARVILFIDMYLFVPLEITTCLKFLTTYRTRVTFFTDMYFFVPLEITTCRKFLATYSARVTLFTVVLAHMSAQEITSFKTHVAFLQVARIPSRQW